MSSNHKLSLQSAILINLNVMIGTGIFVNTSLLSQLAGFFGFVSYILILIGILPLIMCLSALIKTFPTGNLYTYGAKTVSPFAGFFAAWAYFTGKLGSVSLLVHVFSTLSQTIIPGFALINVYIIDAFIITLFCWLNTLNMHIGKVLMYLFFLFKTTPIIFALISCISLWHTWTIPAESLKWSGVPATLPLVLFAFAGFEAICAIANKIENPEKNGPRALIISLALVVSLTIMYQLLFFITVPKALMHVKSFLETFPALLTVLMPTAGGAQQGFILLLHSIIALASLGGAYSIIFSNQWNLYTLAAHNHTFFKNKLSHLNQHHIPFWCIIVEGVLAFVYICITRGQTMLLQQISVLGLTLALLICTLGIMWAPRKGIAIETSLPGWLALGSCVIFIGTILNNFYLFGLSALIIFSTILTFGIWMYIFTRRLANFKR